MREARRGDYGTSNLVWVREQGVSIGAGEPVALATVQVAEADSALKSAGGCATASTSPPVVDDFLERVKKATPEGQPGMDEVRATLLKYPDIAPLALPREPRA